MDLPASISSPATKADACSSVNDAAIALRPIAYKSPSSSLTSVPEYSEALGTVPGIPSGGHGSLNHDVPTISDVKPSTLKFREYIQLIALCGSLYIEGWNDGTNGPLLPRIQKVYGIDYTIASMIFVFACVGFIVGALSNVILTEKLGFGKVMILGSLFQIVAYSVNSAAPRFPLFVFAYFLNGIGLALQNAQAIGYVACFKEKPEAKMGFLLAVYGGGALTAPLVATQFAQMKHWSFHYLISLGIVLINTVVLFVVFGFKRQQECLAQLGIPLEEKGANERSDFRQIIALRDAHILALFTLLYVGVEVATGGWITTFMIEVRGGGASSGYVSTGFYAGLVIGRVALLWVNEKMGEYLALLVYTACAIGLEFVVWFVPSLVGDAVAVAFVGILMGPMYPLAVNHGGRVFPPRLMSGAIGWISGLGHAGSALMPFMAGAIASKAGIVSLQPMLVGSLTLMAITWLSISKKCKASH